MSRLMIYRIVFALLVGVLGVAVGAHWGSSKPTLRPAPVMLSDRSRHVGNDEHTAERLAGLSSEIAELRTKIGEQERERQEQGGVEDAGTSSAPKTLQEERQEWRDQLEEVEAEFVSEPRDYTWASETVATFRRGLSDFPAIATALRTVECRSAHCRVEIGPSDSDELSRDLPVFLHNLAPVLPSAKFDQVDAGNGKKMLVAYLSRDSESSANSPPNSE